MECDMVNRYKFLGQVIEITDKERQQIEDNVLRNYIHLNQVVKSLDEDECLKALCVEKIGLGRLNVMYRLHRVYSELRMKRERKEHNIRKV